MQKAKAFLEKLQEGPSSGAERMEKARAFSQSLHGESPAKTSEDSDSELHLDIADAMYKMLKTSDTTARRELRKSLDPDDGRGTIDIYKELDQELQDICKLYKDIAKFTKEVLWKIEEETPIRVEDIESEISRLADKLILGSQEALFLSTRAAEYNEDYLASSMINVSIIAMSIAMRLGYNKSKLVQLGGCAFLANVGMIKLMHIVTRPEKLKQREYKEIKNHPLYGAEILEKLGFPEIYVKVAQQQHERENGFGYPYGLKGNEIHEYAKIVGLAEIVESLSHHRAYRSSLPIHEVVKEVVETWKDSFSPRIMKALVESLGIYPVGTMVELTSGEVAKIIKNNPTSFLRPVVQILGKEDDLAEQPKIVDLTENPFLYIKRPLEATKRAKKDRDPQ